MNEAKRRARRSFPLAIGPQAMPGAKPAPATVAAALRAHFFGECSGRGVEKILGRRVRPLSVDPRVPDGFLLVGQNFARIFREVVVDG
jgi:hypothetical protein